VPTVEQWIEIGKLCLLPFAAWVGRWMTLRRQEQAKATTSVHDEILKMRTERDELRRTNGEQATTIATQGVKIEDYGRRLDSLEKELISAETARDALRLRETWFNSLVAVLRTRGLILANAVADYRQRMQEAGLPLPPEPILPPEPTEAAPSA